MGKTGMHIVLTAEGHVKGMLDRDQRTAKLACHIVRNSDYHKVKPGTAPTINPDSIEKSTKNSTRHSRQKFRRNHAYMWKTWQRLRNVLIVCVFISAIHVPSLFVSSAPAISPMADRMNTIPQWINPCDTGSENGAATSDPSTAEGANQLPDKELLKTLVDASNIAMLRAEEFRDDFIDKNFNSNFKDIHEAWKHVRYDWLPSKEQIPKELGQNLSASYLNSLKLDESLLNVYEYLQRFAVGLEQIIWDQEDLRSPHLQNFTLAQGLLQNVLCEIHWAMVERHVRQRPDVTRDIMPENQRVMEATHKKLRDWLIYRDYMNALEYVVQVFSHFRSKQG